VNYKWQKKDSFNKISIKKSNKAKQRKKFIFNLNDYKTKYVQRNKAEKNKLSSVLVLLVLDENLISSL